MRSLQLTECPVCLGSIDVPQKLCPGCGAELAPYYEQLDKANDLLVEAYNAISRGETLRARELGQQALSQTPLAAVQGAMLQTRVALVEHCYADAWEQALTLPESLPARAKLMEDIRVLYENETNGKHHFNLALTSARRGYWPDASYHVGIAVDLIPYLESVWRLAVKVELRRGRFDVAASYLEDGRRRFPEEPFLSSLARELD